MAFGIPSGGMTPYIRMQAPRSTAQGNFGNSKQPVQPIQGGQQRPQQAGQGQQPQRKVTAWGQNYFPPPNNPNASPADWLHERDGLTKTKHGEIGVGAHEKAHHAKGMELLAPLGVQIGPPVLERNGDGSVKGGKVTINAPQVEYSRLGDKAYFDKMVNMQEGIIEMAEAPSKPGNMQQHATQDISGLEKYGTLSTADKNIAANAKIELRKIELSMIKSQGGQQGQANGPQAPNKIAQENAALMAYNQPLNAQQGHF
jgi:hypothetical protein